MLLIKNARLIDPSSKLDKTADILIFNGKIARIEKDLSKDKDTQIIEARGLIAVPGLIDMHVHLRDPGRPDEETIASGSAAAAKGGFTSIVCMANTEPPVDDASIVEYILIKAKKDAVVNVFPMACVTKKMQGEEITEMAELVKAGAVGFSDDGKPSMKAEIMRRAMEYAKMLNVPIFSHPEERSLSESGVMNEGYVSTILGLKGIPHQAEEIIVGRDIELARDFGYVHLTHISTAGSVELIRRAKKNKLPVTCDTTIHHLILSEEDLNGYNTLAKVNPPLRTKKDIQALLEGLLDGTIDAVISDHAPHSEEEKIVEFNEAAFGMIGLETFFSLFLTEDVEKNKIPLSLAIAKLTQGPASILRIKNKARLKEGFDADITIFDLQKNWTVDLNKFISKSKNSPFQGKRLKGKVAYTIVGGKIVYQEKD